MTIKDQLDRIFEQLQNDEKMNALQDELNKNPERREEIIRKWAEDALNEAKEPLCTLEINGIYIGDTENVVFFENRDNPEEEPILIEGDKELFRDRRNYIKMDIRKMV